MTSAISHYNFNNCATNIVRELDKIDRIGHKGYSYVTEKSLSLQPLGSKGKRSKLCRLVGAWAHCKVFRSSGTNVPTRHAACSAAKLILLSTLMCELSFCN